MSELSFRIIDFRIYFFIFIIAKKITQKKSAQKNKNSNQNKTLIKNKNPHQRGEGLL